MARYLLLGFELDLYSDTECAMVAFYLCHISKCHLELLRIRREADPVSALHISRLSISEESPNGTSSDGLLALDAKARDIEARSSFFAGLFQLVLYLESVKKIRGPTNPHYNPKLHFEHRFKVIRKMGTLQKLEYQEFELARKAVLDVSVSFSRY